MSVHTHIGDAIHDAIAAEPRCGLVRYGGTSVSPDGASRRVYIELGASLPVNVLTQCTDWVTDVHISVQATAVPGVHRSPQHAADELGTLVRRLLVLHPDNPLTERLRALDAIGYHADNGVATYAEGAIARDIHPGASPVGVETFSVRVVHRIAWAT